MNKLHIKLLIVTTALFCLSAVQPAKAAEPTYNGKPLSEWLFELDLSPSVYESIYHPQPGEPSPADAVRQIGTNGIPTLLDILGATELSKGHVLGKLKSKAFREKFHNKNVPTEDLRDTAVQGFGILGTNAMSAIPQISKLLQKPETSYSAAEALTDLGPEGFAVLTNTMNNNKELAGVVVWTIGHKSGGDVQTVTRLLIGALKNSDAATRGNAAYFLGGKDPAVAIPVLVQMLDDSGYYPRERAALALSTYGPAAKAAVPKLLSLYTNSWIPEYMWALKSIDTGAAAEAEQLLVNSGPLNKARDGYTETLLADGMKLIAGGYVDTAIIKIPNRCLSKTELLDPKTGKWTETGEMNVARYGHAAILLQSGKVLVAGGSDDKGHDLTSAELYDPVTGKWTETGSMNSAHVNEPATLQSDGKVWIKGDWNGRQFNEDELYDSATEKWTIIPKKKE